MKADREIPPIPGYVTTVEAGKMLGVNRITICRYYWEGKMNVYRLGYVFAVPIEEIEKLKGKKELTNVY